MLYSESYILYRSLYICMVDHMICYGTQVKCKANRQLVCTLTQLWNRKEAIYEAIIRKAMCMRQTCVIGEADHKARVCNMCYP